MYYTTQEIPQIDTEIAQKGHFRMKANYNREIDHTYIVMSIKKD